VYKRLYDCRRPVVCLDETKVNWQFATADARIKLRRLYPSIDE